MTSISFDKPTLDELKRYYSIAVKLGNESFIFMGHELDTRYAKYLIQYVAQKLKEKPE